MITLTIILIALPVILIIAFFSSKGIKTSASITIGQPRQKVFDFLVQLKNQEYYNAWMMIDPKMQKTYTGTDGESGFILAWKAKTKRMARHPSAL
jgi:hypothetical protein